MHFIYILESKPLIQNFSGRYIPAIYNLLFKNYFFHKGDGKAARVRKISDYLHPSSRGKKMITFGKRNFICHSFIIFTVTFKMHRSIQCTWHQIRFPKIEHSNNYLTYRTKSQFVLNLSNWKCKIVHILKHTTNGNRLPTCLKWAKSLNPCNIGSGFHYRKRKHWEHNNSAGENTGIWNLNNIQLMATLALTSD